MTFKIPSAMKDTDSSPHLAGRAAAFISISKPSLALVKACAVALALSACSGGGEVGNDDAVDPNTPVGVVCDGQCANANTFLTVDDVKKVMAQAIAEAQA